MSLQAHTCFDNFNESSEKNVFRCGELILSLITLRLFLQSRTKNWYITSSHGATTITWSSVPPKSRRRAGSSRVVQKSQVPFMFNQQSWFWQNIQMCSTHLQSKSTEACVKFNDIPKSHQGACVHKNCGQTVWHCLHINTNMFVYLNPTARSLCRLAAGSRWPMPTCHDDSGSLWS